MDKNTAIEFAKKAGMAWPTTKDIGDELLCFAKLIAAHEREECAKLCEKHYDEPQIMRVTGIQENPFSGAALDCAALIRLRDDSK